MAYQLTKSSGGTNIVSEQFTSYDMSPDDLSAKSNSTNRPMYDYVTVNGMAQVFLHLMIPINQTRLVVILLLIIYNKNVWMKSIKFYLTNNQ